MLLRRVIGLIALLVTFRSLAAPEAAPPDLSSPSRAVRTFVDASGRGDFAVAAQVLDLGRLPPDQRAARGPILARRLRAVLDAAPWIDLDQVPDLPPGPGATGAELLGKIPLDHRMVPVRLERDPGGSWRFAAATVAEIDELYLPHGPRWIVEHLPPALVRWRWLDVAAWQWIGLVVGVIALVAVARLLSSAALAVARRVARRTRATWDDELVAQMEGPVRLLASLAAVEALPPLVSLATPARDTIGSSLRMLFTLALTWAGTRAVKFVAGLLETRFTEGVPAAAARGARTQVAVLRRVATVAVAVLGGALVLLQFDAFRTLGTSVLASAGVLGLTVGFAAQRSLATLLAGIQISMTQPVRIGDVVIVEGEWGTVEEITLTYVVLRIWDLRRLVVPIGRFLDTPFQNWTRTSPDLLGTVFLHADYRVPVEDMRAELARFVATREDWDRKVVGLQVTDATPGTVEVRALVSAADASKAWDLRCAVREHLVTWLQQADGGRYLPRTRYEESGGSREPRARGESTGS